MAYSWTLCMWHRMALNEEGRKVKGATMDSFHCLSADSSIARVCVNPVQEASTEAHWGLLVPRPMLWCHDVSQRHDVISGHAFQRHSSWEFVESVNNHSTGGWAVLAAEMAHALQLPCKWGSHWSTSSCNHPPVRIHSTCYLVPQERNVSASTSTLWWISFHTVCRATPAVDMVTYCRLPLLLLLFFLVTFGRDISTWNYASIDL